MKTLEARTPFSRCESRFEVHTDSTTPAISGQYATVIVSTGAAHVQTYLTASECKRLASMLLDAAIELQAVEVAA